MLRSLRIVLSFQIRFLHPPSFFLPTLDGQIDDDDESSLFYSHFYTNQIQQKLFRLFFLMDRYYVSQI